MFGWQHCLLYKQTIVICKWKKGILYETSCFSTYYWLILIAVSAVADTHMGGVPKTALHTWASGFRINTFTGTGPGTDYTFHSGTLQCGPMHLRVTQVQAVTVYQGFRDEARIRKTYTISAVPRWDRKIAKCKQQSTINDLAL